MTSKREQLAMAVYAEYCRRMNAVVGWEGIKPPAWEGLAESSRNDYRMTVDVVLNELREPTREMIVAGRRKPEIPSEEHRIGTADCDVNAILPRADDGERANSFMTTLRYQAMIDEAMK